MADRHFSELEVRHMLSVASALRRDVVPARWIITTRHRRKAWEAIVEPDPTAQLLVVISAYRVEP